MKGKLRFFAGGVLAVAVLLMAIGMVMAYDGPDGENNPQFPPGGARQVADGPLASATADMAHRLGVNLSDINVEKIEDATWPDTSLGAPRPGEIYAQVVTPGFVLTLNAGEHTYVYHTDTTSSAVLAVMTQG